MAAVVRNYQCINPEKWILTILIVEGELLVFVISLVVSVGSVPLVLPSFEQLLVL